MARSDPGRSVALREIWHGRVWTARAATVVEDRDDHATFFIPAGTRWMAATRNGEIEKVPRGDYELVPHVYAEADVLSFGWPDAWYAILLFWRDGDPWDYYVNLQEPLRRSRVGFDTLDLELDAIVELDGTWRWKDEDELEEAIARGVLSPEDEPRLRAEGERAVRRILDREPPFDRNWWSWRPDPTWSRPTLPDGWDRVDP